MGLVACSHIQWKRLSEENEDLSEQVTKLSSMHFEVLYDLNQAKRLLVGGGKLDASLPYFL